MKNIITIQHTQSVHHTNPEESILIVSHGGTLSIFNAMWLALKIEDLNSIELFGNAGGVSFFHESESGKRIIKRLSDMSYVIG